MEGPGRDSYHFAHVMNISTQKIKQLFGGAIHGGRHYGDHGMIHPQREWSVVLVVGFLLVVVGAAWAVRVYWHYDQMIKDPSFLETTSDPTYRAAMVDQALLVLSERRKQYEQIERKLGGGVGGQVTEPVALPETSVATSTATTSTPASTEIVSDDVPELATTTEEVVEVEFVPGAVEVSN